VPKKECLSNSSGGRKREKRHAGPTAGLAATKQYQVSFMRVIDPVTNILSRACSIHLGITIVASSLQKLSYRKCTLMQLSFLLLYDCLHYK
jgi:hypothetical protein